MHRRATKVAPLYIKLFGWLPALVKSAGSFFVFPHNVDVKNVAEICFLRHLFGTLYSNGQ